MGLTPKHNARISRCATNAADKHTDPADFAPRTYTLDQRLS
jgi:hypothetical protein